MEPTDASSMEELIQTLLKIDEDRDCDTRRLRDLACGLSAVTADGEFDFSALEGREELGELEPPLLSQQELLTTGSWDDFLHFDRVVEEQEEAKRQLKSADDVSLDHFGSRSTAFTQQKIGFVAAQPSVDSPWKDHETELLPFTKMKQEPDKLQWIEAMFSDVAAPANVPGMDARVFAPEFSVRIKDEPMPMVARSYHGVQPPLCSPSFLAGPIPVAAADSIRGPRAQCSNEARKRPRMSNSRLSEIRRAGAARRPRKSGRFLSKIPFVSVTTLQGERAPKTDPTDDHKRPVLSVYEPKHEIKTEPSLKFHVKMEPKAQSVYLSEKKCEIKTQKAEDRVWPPLIDDKEASSDIEELIKVLVKIDCDDVSSAMHMKSPLDQENDPAVSSQMNELFFAGLDGKAGLEELDRPLPKKEEKLQSDSILDLMLIVKRDEAYFQTKEDPSVLLPAQSFYFSDKTRAEKKVETAARVTSDSDSSDYDSHWFPDGEPKREQEQLKLHSVETPMKAETFHGASLPIPRNQIDARIFVPKSHVQIEGRSTGSIDALRTSSFLAGPALAPALSSPPESSRESRVRCWNDRRKCRSRVNPSSDSHISRVRRAGADGRARRNGRFTKTGTQLVSITELQHD